MKEFADGNFKFDENRRKFFKRIENTVGKGEIVHQSNFSFSHIVFKTCTADTYKPGLVWERVKMLNASAKFSKGECLQCPLHHFALLSVYIRLRELATN